MNRQLDETEKELTQKGLDRVTKEKEDYTKSLEAMKYHKEFLEQKRKYDDYMRPFNRAKEDKEIDVSIKGYESELKICDEKIKVMEEQLKNGVPVKEIPVGVE